MLTNSQVHLRAAGTALFLTASFLVVRTASAQTPDSRWQPWLGCWVASDDPRSGSPSDNGVDGMVCVVPAVRGAGVVIATISNGVVVHREPMNPTGARAPKTLDNCPGWESGSWSADAGRLLMRSEFTCGNNVVVRGSGVFAISRDGDWIQVQGSSVGAGTSARAVRYEPAGLQIVSKDGGPIGDSTAVRFVTASTGFGARSVRGAAGEAVRHDAVLEVAQHVDGAVAEVWLKEIGQEFEVDARELLRLSDAGMPPNLIDLMVALSYPQRFALERTEAMAADLRNRSGSTRSAFGSGGGFGRVNRYDVRWDCGYGNRMLSYGYYGDSCYPGYYGLNGYGYGYGYGSYGYGSGYYWGQRPIVIVDRLPETTSQSRGRAVNGSGYTRGSAPSGTRGSSSASDRAPSSSSGSSSGTSSSTGSSSSSGSSSSGSSGSSEPRTAKPRVPPG